MDYDDQLRLDCVKTGDPLNKRFSRAPDTSVDALAKEFEDEMEMELDCVFQKQQNTWSTSSTAAPRTSIEAPGPSSNSKYDDDYFDSSDDEKVTDRRVKSNDELLYDPAADDQDEQWMAQRGTLVEKAPNSDAVLNCPSCMSVLCVDCQRHATYHTQYRAMFAINTATNDKEILRYKKKEPKRKRGRKKQRQKPETKKERSRSRSKSLNRASDAEQSESDREDLFHPVSCKVCHTEVGVLDADELIHFFNVIASHK